MLLECLQTSFGREGKRWSLSSSWRTTVVHAFLPSQCVRHWSTVLEGRFWRYHLRSLCSRMPATRVFRFHGLTSSASVRFLTSPSNGLGPGVAWAVRRPSVHHGPHPASSARRSQRAPCHERCHTPWRPSEISVASCTRCSVPQSPDNPLSFGGQVPFVIDFSQIARSRALRHDHMFFFLESVTKCPYLPLRGPLVRSRTLLHSNKKELHQPFRLVEHGSPHRRNTIHLSLSSGTLCGSWFKQSRWCLGRP